MNNVHITHIPEREHGVKLIQKYVLKCKVILEKSNSEVKLNQKYHEWLDLNVSLKPG